jgi:hypothetical protein
MKPRMLKEYRPRLAGVFFLRHAPPKASQAETRGALADYFL